MVLATISSIAEQSPFVGLDVICNSVGRLDQRNFLVGRLAVQWQDAAAGSVREWLAFDVMSQMGDIMGGWTSAERRVAVEVADLLVEA